MTVPGLSMPSRYGTETLSRALTNYAVPRSSGKRRSLGRSVSKHPWSAIKPGGLRWSRSEGRRDDEGVTNTGDAVDTVSTIRGDAFAFVAMRSFDESLSWA